MKVAPRRPWIAALVVIGCLSSSGLAGVIRHDVSDSEYLSLAQDSRYDSVGRITLLADDNLNYAASGTLVSSEWVLTAAHVVEDAVNMSFHIGGNTYTATEWVYHPDWNGDLSSGNDIALLKLDTSLSISAATLYDGKNEVGSLATLVGYGMTGDGLTGATTYDAQKRAGQNMIDSLIRTGGPPKNSKLLAMDFDSPIDSFNVMGSSTPVDMEYLISFGDSGGAVFIEEGGLTYLAGVHSFGVDYNGNGLWSDYGDYTGHTRVSMHYDWILSILGLTDGGGDGGDGGGGGNNGKGGGPPSGKGPKIAGTELGLDSHMPEPASASLLILGSLTLLNRRRRR